MNSPLNNGSHVPGEPPANRFHLAFSCTFQSFLFSHGPFGQFTVFLPLPLSLRKGTPFLWRKKKKKKKNVREREHSSSLFTSPHAMVFFTSFSQQKKTRGFPRCLITAKHRRSELREQQIVVPSVSLSTAVWICLIFLWTVNFSASFKRLSQRCLVYLCLKKPQTLKSSQGAAPAGAGVLFWFVGEAPMKFTVPFSTKISNILYLQ